jgi:ATP-binding cassette subfamily B multidrug efflux pump
MCCASPSAGLKAILPGGSPTGSCRPRPAAGEAVFQVFDMAAFACATFVGALLMLADADPRLMMPLLVWFAGYPALMRWTIRRAGPAATASSDARSAVTGRVVDSYTNIHSVKLFAHQGARSTMPSEAIETRAQTFQKSKCASSPRWT